MNTKRLGNSDLFITPIGFGAWAIGGSGWEFAWGAQDDGDSIAAIRAALDAGVNWIDTAAVYGLGHSEDVVARALAGVRERPYVFTKCSMVWKDRRKIGHSLKADSIRRECEASLRRLRVDAIDLYQIHWPIPDDEIEEGWATMAACLLSIVICFLVAGATGALCRAGFGVCIAFIAVTIHETAY